MLMKRLATSRPFALIAGLNVIESYDAMLRTAERLAEIAGRENIAFVFKASFDKANRSNEGAFRGPGVQQGLEYLSRLKSAVKDLAIVTDVHEREQCAMARDAGLDMIQIPAFLCRQTDLIYAAADTGLPLLLKKGQFASADVMKAAVAKAQSRTNYSGAIICDRGTCFGSDQLIADMRNLVQLRGSQALVAFDATHAAQKPAARVREGAGSDGDLWAVEAYARAAVAIGIDCLFIEIHENPLEAPVDSKVQWPLATFAPMLNELIGIAKASKWRET